jgi:hypothetical protein
MVVAELLEEFSMVGQQVGHHALECLIVLDADILLVRAVLIELLSVCGNTGIEKWIQPISLCSSYVQADQLLDLLVKNGVGNHDDGVKDWLSILLDSDELMRKPSNLVGLSASSRVLNQISPSNFFGRCVC